MYETGLPYVLDPHTLDTLGTDTFNGALMLSQFAAHFRIDSENDVSEGRSEGVRKGEKGGRGGEGEGG